MLRQYAAEAHVHVEVGWRRSSCLRLSETSTLEERCGGKVLHTAATLQQTPHLPIGAWYRASFRYGIIPVGAFSTICAGQLIAAVSAACREASSGVTAAPSPSASLPAVLVGP